jgi:flagellar biosynthesis protein FliP
MLPLLLAADPGVQLTINGGGSASVKLFLLMTALSFASAALVSVTSFARIIIVLSFLRQALGTPQLPPNQVMVGLALALSCFVMAPTGTRVYDEALGPYFDDQLSPIEAAKRASVPIRTFLVSHTHEEDLLLFTRIAKAEQVPLDEIPLNIAVPAFMVSELSTAFRMGLFIFIPFLLIDLLVAAILMSLGMMMVPPTLVSLPLKVGVFLLAGGWHLVVASLVASFNGI